MRRAVFFSRRSVRGSWLVPGASLAISAAKWAPRGPRLGDLWGLLGGFGAPGNSKNQTCIFLAF